jgi:HAD superfamily hydrolase (TIGR01509 family)
MSSHRPGKVSFDALVFDLGGVIIPHDNQLLCRRLAARCTVSDALQRVAETAADPRYYTGELTIGALHEELRRELGYLQDWNEFLADWTCHLTVDHRMLDLVSRLADSMRVMLFSNTHPEHWRHLVALSDGKLAGFEAYLSFEMGLAKPSLEAFQSVAAQAGIDPGRSLFVDDLPVNVEAARRAGFRAEVFVGQSSLERHLGI